MRHLICSIILFLAVSGLTAQTKTGLWQDTIHRLTVIDGDTLWHINLKEIVILAPPLFKNPYQERQYWKLIYNIKKVLPYAKIIAATIDELDYKISQVSSEKERKKIIKFAEDSLFKRYEKEMKQMTVSQGKLLFKLVDRETTNTTYYWISAYKGSVSAVFWQGMARIFGSNLKSEYDPNGEDKDIERIITYLEKGYF